MTLHEITKHLFDLTKGHINGEKFSRQELEHVLFKWLDHSERNKVPFTHYIEISLPDGNWLSSVSKYGTEYGYYIPETREQEKRLWDRLTGKEN